MSVDPYSFGFWVFSYFFIGPWVFHHIRKSRPELPSSIKTAANILFATGGIFMVVGGVCGVLFADLPRPWRFVWVATAGIGGVLWIWNAFCLRDGIRSARWASIPFLLVTFVCLPILGWIEAPAAAYCLFFDSNAKKFYRGQQGVQYRI